MKRSANTMRRRAVIAVFLLVLAVIGSSCAIRQQQMQQKLAALEAMPGRFTFVVFGDNRSGDAVYQGVVTLAMKHKPDFVLNTGDEIATPGDLRQWSKFWEMSRPISVPYFLTVGNHDVNAMVPSSEQIYREQVDLPGNKLYYSFIAGNSLFIVLDSCLKNQENKIVGEQYEWLEAVLAASPQMHKFVFLHHPLYTERGKGKHAGDSMDKYAPERDRLESLLIKYHVDTIFSGHEHYYARREINGIQHIITGGGGAPLYAEDKDGGFYHIVVVTVDGKTISAETVDIDGKVRDRF